MISKRQWAVGFLYLLLSTTAAAAEPSADEVAKELANPNTPLATLKFKLQHRLYTGDLAGADDQGNTTLVFQPSLPFPLNNGDKIIFRPAIPFQFDLPVYDATNLNFGSDTGLGDIGYDLVYAITTKSGLITAYGVIGSIPTASEDGLGSDRWTLGPEILIGQISQTSVLGMLPSHQVDIGGSGNADISLTTIQVFGIYLPGGGWSIGSSPIFTYDHETDQATIPLNINLGKTIIAGGRPWKLGMELNYYLEQPDAFGPEWMIGFDIAPVVENSLVNWVK
jgi:hypothetical protein